MPQSFKLTGTQPDPSSADTSNSLTGKMQLMLEFDPEYGQLGGAFRVSLNRMSCIDGTPSLGPGHWMSLWRVGQVTGGGATG